jgi:hypothetical protein
MRVGFLSIFGVIKNNIFLIAVIYYLLPQLLKEICHHKIRNEPKRRGNSILQEARGSTILR